MHILITGAAGMLGRKLTESLVKSGLGGRPVEALALLATEDTFDLVFTDLSLHGHDQAGLALAAEATRMREGVPVLYTTGQGLTDGMKAMFVDGSSFLPKPYTFEQLSAAVTAALKSK